MQLAVDPAFGERAEWLLVRLRRAFGDGLRPFLAPAAPPDPGLEAAFGVGSLAALVPAEPTPWLQRLANPTIRLDDADDVVERVSAGLGLTLPPPATAQPLRLAALGTESLVQGLAQLPPGWRLEIGPGSGLAGLTVELAKGWRFQAYLEAADFAHGVATIAERQNHHPTLVHSYRLVTVRVSTGEAGKRLTERDLVFATAVDRLAHSLTATTG